MKWEHAGQEFESEYSKIVDKYTSKNLYIYGAGMVGQRIAKSVSRFSDMSVKGFIDKDESKVTCDGLPVFHWDAISDILSQKANMIVIGLSDQMGDNVRKTIVGKMNMENDRCISYQQFVMHEFPILLFYKYNKVFLDTISMIVTEKCTLRCKNCAIMLPYLKVTEDASLVQLKEEADQLFEWADFIGNFTITGGEPLLRRDLCELIAYIGTRYRDRIGSFKIITNGMIKPSDSLLFVMKKYDVAVEVSDYTIAVPKIKQRVLNHVSLYQKSGINTYFLNSGKWVDFGFENVENSYSDNQAIQFFGYCHTRCRGYVSGKLLYCINAYFAAKALDKEDDGNNVFDIKHLPMNDENRAKLIEFDQGYSKQGYLNMCQHCNGTVEINRHYIEAGEQL